tara:strand:- start:5738 stop:6748 length:1011 start_codon:yes stop_codon:yes gene_type:complete
MKFIQFGCWNKDFCSLDEPYLSPISNVMHNIKSKVESESYDFLIISGDNYYPDNIKFENKEFEDKKLKIKIFDFEKFISGFICLSNLNIPKYLLFGNHEYNDIVVLKEEMDRINSLPKKEKEKELLSLNFYKCKSLEQQKNLASSDNSITIFEYVLFYNDDSTNTLLIMIDTTIYDNVKVKECYENILGESDIENIDIERIKILQFTKILEILNIYSEASTIIFSGHHPIIWCKNKNGDKFDYVEELINLFIQFEEFLFQKKIIYLCADTHLYQKGYVLIKCNNDNILPIEQHIVGTGGTDLDNICEISNYKLFSSRYHDELSEKKKFISRRTINK